MQPKRIAILTAIHRRHALSAAVLAHTARLAEAASDIAECRQFVVYSRADWEPMAEALRDWPPCTAQWIEAPNRPVSQKWQKSLDFIRRDWEDVDAILRIDSDDFLNAAYFRAAIEASASADGLGPDRVYFLDQESGKLGLWKGPWYIMQAHPIPAGAGRLFNRGMLDAVDWQLWPRPQDSCLNMLCSRTLYDRGYMLKILNLSEIPGAAIVDVKTAENIHPWSEFRLPKIWEPEEARRLLRNLQLGGALDVPSYAIA